MKLAEDRKVRIDELIAAGETNEAIMALLKCSSHTVVKRRAALGSTHVDALTDAILAHLKKAKKITWTVEELADRLDVGPAKVRASVAKLQASGHNIDLAKGVELLRQVETSGVSKIDISKFKGETIRFGLTADNHLASKYQRLDVLNALFDIWQDQGINTVYQLGNMIDGEARFNRFDLLAHGMDSQCNYFAEHWPARPGMKTHFITGDDHEGWYIQREGVEIGRMLEGYARSAGREDLIYLGHVEHDIVYKAKRGSAVMRLIHAGGGSAYATSYTAQKIVECVPADTKALTPYGWVFGHQLTVGDTILGYNPAASKCEWTQVLALNKGQAEVVSYENDQFKVRCTRNHKWAMDVEHRAGPNPASKVPVPYRRETREMLTIDEIINDWRRARIVQAAEGPSGKGSEFGNDHLEWINRPDAVSIVLAMTKEQRQGFVYGMLVGEGTVSGVSVVFSQRPGPVQDAFVLACFLEGIACGTTQLTSKKMNGDIKVCGRTTVLRKPRRMVNSMEEVGSSYEDVWCPTTALGTWVMQQGSVVSITGNSYQGGEKPNVLLIGHYHKAEYGYPREVHVVQAGTTEDQSVFMRKLKIQAHVGGWTISFDIDDDGLIHAFTPQWHPFYDRAFYENDHTKQWSYKWDKVKGPLASVVQVGLVGKKQSRFDEPFDGGRGRGGNGGK